MTRDSVLAQPPVAADAVEQVTVGDAGRGKEDIVPGDQVVGGQNPVEVVAGVDCRLAFLVVAGPELADDFPAEALDRGRGEHAFGVPPMPQSRSMPVSSETRPAARPDVTVGDEADRRAGLLTS